MIDRIPIHIQFDLKATGLLIFSGLMTSMVVVVPLIYINIDFALGVLTISTLVALFFASLFLLYKRALLIVAIVPSFTFFLPWWTLSSAFFYLCFYPYATWKVIAFSIPALLVIFGCISEIKKADYKLASKLYRKNKAITFEQGRYWYHRTDISNAVHSMRSKRVKDVFYYADKSIALFVFTFGPLLYGLSFVLGKQGEVDLRFVVAGSFMLVVAWGGRLMLTQLWIAIRYLNEQEQQLSQQAKE